MSGMMMMVMMMPTALIGFCVNWAVRLSIAGPAAYQESDAARARR